MTEHFYLNHRWYPNGYFLFDSKWAWEYFIFYKAPDSFVLYLGNSLDVCGFLFLCRDAISVFYCPNLQSDREEK